MRVLGIDPGQSGGLALLDAKGKTLAIYKMPEEEPDIFEAIWKCQEGAKPGDIKAYLERVSAAPRMGTVSAFTFGRGYGGLRMALIACKIPFEDITPRKWQRFLGLSEKTGRREITDVDTTAKKNRHKDKAQELWPDVHIIHAIADALLIAEFGRRMENGFGADLP